MTEILLVMAEPMPWLDVEWAGKNSLAASPACSFRHMWVHLWVENACSSPHLSVLRRDAGAPALSPSFLASWPTHRFCRTEFLGTDMPSKQSAGMTTPSCNFSLQTAFDSKHLRDRFVRGSYSCMAQWRWLPRPIFVPSAFCITYLVSLPKTARRIDH